jgi:hypothetical protein
LVLFSVEDEEGEEEGNKKGDNDENEIDVDER